MATLTVRSRSFAHRRIATGLVILAIAASPFAGVARAVVPPGLVNPPNRPMQTLHAFRCQKMANKGVAKFLSAWSKTYTKCVGAIAACVQTKDSDPDCLAKAADGCNKNIPNLGDDTEKQAGAVLEDGAITSFCGSLSPTEAFDDDGGPRFSLLIDPCLNRFNRHVSKDVQSFAFCLLEQVNCVAERLLLVQMPRARDLLATANITIGHAVDATHSCLLNESGAGALGDPKPGKALLGCQKSAEKAGVSFAAKARGSFSKCTDAIMNCAQLKPTQKCVDSAGAKCAKAVLAVDDAQTKLADTITKACEKIPFGDLQSADGGDVGALASLCTSVGVSSLAMPHDYGTCLANYERCQVEDSINFTVPRIEEFFTATSQPSPFNSAFCPAP